MYLNSVLPPYTCIHVQMRFTIKFVNKRSDFWDIFESIEILLVPTKYGKDITQLGSSI